MSTHRSIAIYRDGEPHRRLKVIATTDTENPDAAIELIRPYLDNSGNEVLVSLTAAEWAEVVGFIQEQVPETTSGEGA